jgi:hypothetical protein
MAKYLVWQKEVVSVCYEIEADSQEQAKNDVLIGNYEEEDVKISEFLHVFGDGEQYVEGDE